MRNLSTLREFAYARSWYGGTSYVDGLMYLTFIGRKVAERAVRETDWEGPLRSVKIQPGEQVAIVIVEHIRSDVHGHNALHEPVAADGYSWSFGACKVYLALESLSDGEKWAAEPAVRATGKGSCVLSSWNVGARVTIGRMFQI